MISDDRKNIGCVIFFVAIIIGNVVYGIKDSYKKHMQLDFGEYYTEAIHINESEGYEIVHITRCPCYDPFFKNKKKIDNFIKERHVGFCPVCCGVDDVFDFWVKSAENTSRQEGVEKYDLEIPEDCDWEPSYVYNYKTKKHRPESITYHE